MARPRRLVFVWENLGPTHDDRLSALAAAVGAPERVIAIEFFERSETYLWDRVGTTRYQIDTLVRQGRSRSRLILGVKLIAKLVTIRNADFFLCHYHELPVLITATLLRLLGRRVFAMGDSKFDDYARRLPVEIMKALFYAPYLGALTASLRSRDYMAFLGFPRERIALGYDTLSIDRISTLSGMPPAPDGTPFGERDFIIVARHVPKKNIAMAIEAFALWRAAADRPRDLHLCGSGPLEDMLKEQVAQLGLGDHVHFHGFVQSDEVSRLLARSLCLILPSIEEQFGLVIAEAQAAGLPVLVSRNAGACDILLDVGINGFAIDPDVPAGLAALMELFSSDETLWRRFAAAARAGRYAGDCRHFVDGVLTLSGVSRAA